MHPKLRMMAYHADTISHGDTNKQERLGCFHPEEPLNRVSFSSGPVAAKHLSKHFGSERPWVTWPRTPVLTHASRAEGGRLLDGRRSLHHGGRPANGSLLQYFRRVYEMLLITNDTASCNPFGWKRNDLCSQTSVSWKKDSMFEK